MILIKKKLNVHQSIVRKIALLYNKAIQINILEIHYIKSLIKRNLKMRFLKKSLLSYKIFYSII